MYIPVKLILLFIAKAVLIEWTIELCRFLIFILWHNAFPKELLLSHSNRYFHWFINGIETLCVLIMLYLGYDAYLIVLFTLGFVFLVKCVGGWIIAKSC